MYAGGKEAIRKDPSRYYKDLSLIEIGTFDGDIKIGLEEYFKSTHPDYENKFPNELLVNRDFNSELSQWTQQGTVETNVNGAVVNLSNHMYQDVPIEEDKTYLISYDISCESDATMRSQVNWHDAAGKYLSATLERHNCHGNSIVINQIIRPPLGAIVGRFYIAANDDRNITVQSVSFRE